MQQTYEKKAVELVETATVLNHLVDCSSPDTL